MKNNLIYKDGILIGDIPDKKKDRAKWLEEYYNDPVKRHSRDKTRYTFDYFMGLPPKQLGAITQNIFIKEYEQDVKKNVECFIPANGSSGLAKELALFSLRTSREDPAFAEMSDVELLHKFIKIYRQFSPERLEQLYKLTFSG